MAMLGTFLKIAARNVAANWRHSIAAALSIAAAFVALCVFSGYIAEIGAMYTETFENRNMLGQLLVLPPDDPVTPEPVFAAESQKRLVEAFAAEPGVDLWVPFLPISGSISNHATNSIFIGFGYDVEAGRKMRGASWSWNTVAGVPLDQQASSDNVVLGQSLGFILGCRPATQESFISGTGGYTPVDRPFTCVSPLLQLNTTTVRGRANAAEVRVAGLVDGAFKDIDVRYTMMPLALAQELRGQGDVGFYSVRLAAGADALEVQARLQSRLVDLNLKAVVQSWKTHKFGDFFVKSMAFLAIFRNFIVAIIVMIAGLSIYNITTRSVQERTRELGTLRSFGYLPHQLTGLFLSENLLLSSIGSALGAAASVALCYGVNQLHILYQSGFLSQPVPLRLGISVGLAVLTFTLIGLVGLIACYLSCRQAHKLSIVECLNHV